MKFASEATSSESGVNREAAKAVAKAAAEAAAVPGSSSVSDPNTGRPVL